MKAHFLFLILTVTTVNSFAVKVKFTTANMSVNVAEGSIGIFTSFELFPDDFENTDSLNAIEFIDFPFVSYNNIAQVMIDKAMLSTESSPNFLRMASFIITDGISNGSRIDNDIVQGATYVFRLTVMDKNGQEFQLLNRELTIQLANPVLNCVKFNNIYRLAGHNTYQKSVANSLFTSLFFTRVLELDAHLPMPFQPENDWHVIHSSYTSTLTNNNNCGSGNKNFNVCLDDLVNWHNTYPNHDPITVFIDVFDWRSVTHTPTVFDNELIQKVGINNIYKPRDLLGNSFGNMRAAAQQNNWPSMGDLTGKFIFILTGSGGKISEYIAERYLDAVAFSAAKVENISDVVNLPGIWPWLKNDIVFYNLQDFNKLVPGSWGDADFNIGYLTSSLNYVTRTYGIGIFGQPGDYSNSDYNEAINFNMNNIAVGNIDANFNPAGKPINGIQWVPDVTYPALVNDHIYSNYQNVTQAAIYNIVATDLIVEPEAHYRMIAGNNIDLQNNVDIKEGSDVDIRIDDCRYTDYTQRKSTPTGEQLTQEEINVLMHELDKELYGYTPADEKEIVRLYVFPNPTSNIVNISYTNYLLNNAIFTLYDLTGRLVKTENYTPQTEGNQHFSLSINELKTGTYFYTLQVGEQTYNGKVVKINQ